MLTETERKEASQLLLAAETNRVQIPGPSRIWPQITLDDSYAIASLGIADKISRGAKFRGRKVGLTSKAMQRSSRIDEPDFGILLDEMFFRDGARIASDSYCAPRVELELAFVLGARLSGPDVTLTDAIAATDYILPCIELIDARVEDPRTIFDTVADNGAAAGVILGDEKLDPGDFDLPWVGGILLSNNVVEETGLAAGVLEHPANAVVWLANKLAGFGRFIDAGEVILTGSFVRPVWAEAGDTVVADFGDLGTVTVEFT